MSDEASRQLALEWLYEFCLVQCTNTMMANDPSYAGWGNIVEHLNNLVPEVAQVRSDKFKLRASLAKLMMNLSHQSYLDATVTLDDLISQHYRGEMSDDVAKLVLCLRVQTVLAAQDNYEDFFNGINLFLSPVNTPKLAARLRVLQKQMTACIISHGDDVMVDDERIAKIDAEYSIDTLNELAMNLLTEIRQTLPKPVIEDVAGRFLTGGPYSASGKKTVAAAATHARPRAEPVPLAALKRLIPSAGTWERIVNGTDPHVQNFLHPAGASNGYYDGDFGTPISPVKSHTSHKGASAASAPPPPAVKKSAGQQQKVAHSKPTKKQDEDEYAIPSSPNTQKIVNDLKDSSKQLKTVVNDPLNDIVGHDGRIHVLKHVPKKSAKDRLFEDDDDDDDTDATQAPETAASSAHAAAGTTVPIRKRKILDSYTDDEEETWSEAGDPVAVPVGEDEDEVQEDDLDSTTRLPHVPMKKFARIEEHSPTSASKQKRIPWSLEEEENLAKGMREYGHDQKKWQTILTNYKFNPKRSAVDLKDKARVSSFKRKYNFPE